MVGTVSQRPEEQKERGEQLQKKNEDEENKNTIACSQRCLWFVVGRMGPVAWMLLQE